MKFFYKICCFILLSAALVVTAVEIPKPLREMAKKIHENCQNKTGVVDDLLRRAREEHLPDDRTLQCYFHCLLDIVGLIDEDNVVHLEHLLDILPPGLHAIIEKLTSACGTQHGVDGCETAYRTVKCYLEADPEVFKHQFDAIFT